MSKRQYVQIKELKAYFDPDHVDYLIRKGAPVEHINGEACIEAYFLDTLIRFKEEGAPEGVCWERTPGVSFDENNNPLIEIEHVKTGETKWVPMYPWDNGWREAVSKKEK